VVRYDVLALPLPDVPLPNDIATRLAPTSPPGRRINVALQATTKAEVRVRQKVNQLDGFGLYSPIQVAFDWYDYQTHAFTIGELRFGNPVKRDDVLVEDDRDVTLADLNLDEHGRLEYSYHFDDGWRIDVAVEGRHAIKRGVQYPRCIGGGRAGPPEDCGGPGAYQDMLECIREPDTELGREWLEWLGPDYDPEACDLAKINLALRKLRK